MDWNANNWVPWVFSGFGVAVLAGIGKWAYRVYFNAADDEKQNSSNVSISGSDVSGIVAGRDVNIGTVVQGGSGSDSRTQYSETPRPCDIDKAISDVALYLQPQVANSFVGLKVRWRAILKHVSAENESEVFVQFRRRSADPSILVTVDLKDYPILKTVKGGEYVEVAGTIEKVRHVTGIYLGGVQLKFLPPPSKGDLNKLYDV